jgi:LPXTG-site transpeptidase (sortase) family protein
MAKRIRRASPLFLLLLILLAGLIFVPAPQEDVYAATFTVTNTIDLVDDSPGDGICRTAGNDCTLRAAVQEANNLPGDDTIILGAGTYTLTIDVTPGSDDDIAAEDDLDILSENGGITIIGIDPAQTIIEVDGGDTFRVFEVITGNLELRNLTIRNGNADTGNGGGILNRTGNVVLRNVELNGNSAANGGGIYNEFGGVDLLDGTVIGLMANPNTATNDGGGIYSEYSTGLADVININRSTVQYNTAANNGGGVYVLNSGELNIINDASINNNTAGGSGGGVYLQNASVGAGGLTFTVEDSSITANAANATGGFTASALHVQDINGGTIDNATISGNTAANGAAIVLLSSLANSNITLDITNSTIDDNDSNTNDDLGGGGIANLVTAGTAATLNLDNVIVSNNDGNLYGGIWNSGEGATLNVLDSTIDSNTAGGASGGSIPGNGGGITNNDGTVNIEISVISDNTTDGNGGGILNLDTGSGLTDLNVLRSTVSGNTASNGGGGGIANLSGANTTVQTSTISGNDAPNGDGGGIHNSGTGSVVLLESVTVYGNDADRGGGIFNADNVTTIQSVLLAANTAPTGPSCFDTPVQTSAISSNGYNLINNTDGCTITTGTNDILGATSGDINISANLTILNGGPTPTHRLLEGSIAIDAGNCYVGEDFDQRGPGFPRGVSIIPNDPSPDDCDIGAFEVQSTDNVILGDFIWNDLNANGIQDPGEPGINGVDIELLSGETVVATTTTANAPITGEAGYYRFSREIIPPAQQLTLRIVQATLPTDAQLSTPLQGSDPTVDSDFLINGDNEIVFTATFTGGETRVDIDAGFFAPASVGDFVFLDTNGNGIQDPGETGVEGIIVRLFNFDTGTQVADVVTPADDPATPNVDESGLYLFEEELAPGTQYFIRFIIPNSLANPPAPERGLQFTIPNVGQGDGSDVGDDSDAIFTGSDGDGNIIGETEIFEVQGGDTLLNWDAGVNRVGTISGVAWNDDNGNGIYEIGVESPIENYPVVIVNASTGDNVAQVTTSSDGTYSVDLAPGRYRVDFSNIPAPFDTITLPNQGDDEVVDSDADNTQGPAFGQTGEIILSSDTNQPNFNVGVFESVSLGGRVWLDGDADGSFDSEPLYNLGTITLTLLDGNGNVVPNVPPAQVGSGLGSTYTFSGLAPGDYTVSLQLPGGQMLALSPQNTTDDDNDSDFNQGTQVSDVVSLAGGDSVNNIDAGIVNSTSVTGIVWRDDVVRLLDGLYQEDEPLVQNVTVIVLAEDGVTELGRDDTDANGEYVITDLPTGPFILQVVVADDTGFTFQNVAGGINSNVNPFTGRTQDTRLSADPAGNVFNAGLIDAITIGDEVFVDLNANGINDNEPGLAGVTITIVQGGTPAPVDIASNADGSYSLKLQPETDYELRFDQPDGFIFTEPNVGDDDTIDSDAVPTGGDPTIGVITLTTGTTTDRTYDVGFYRLNTITGVVWNDTAPDGQRAIAGEPGVENVTVALLNDGGVEVANTATDSNGFYTISGIEAGTYTIVFDPPSAGPQGFTIQDVGSEDRDSDVNAATGRLAVTVVSGETRTIDAGLVDAVTVTGRAFADFNGLGDQDPGDVGIPGINVTISLLGTPIASITTDANGEYEFAVQGGEGRTYTLQFDRPAGFLGVPQDAAGGDDNLDSDIDPNTGETEPFSVPQGSEPIVRDAGFEPLNTISGTVFADQNGNGREEPSASPPEPGIPNSELAVEINIYEDTNTDGDPDSGTPINTTTIVTDENGDYQILGLPAGDFVVEFILPTGTIFEFTTPEVGSEDADSDVVPATGFTETINIPDGALSQDDETRLANVDAGLIPGNTFSGTVFLDEDGDGVFEPAGDPVETGVAGVIINVYEDTVPLGAPIETLTTDADGNFTSSELASTIDYVLDVFIPANSGFSFTTQGTPVDVVDDADDSDVDDTTGQVTITLPAPAEGPFENIGAGFVPGTPISGLAFQDLDFDGVYEPTGTPAETGLAGVTINVYVDPGMGNPLGTAIRTVTSAADGTYTTGDLAPGDYILEFVEPSGFALTTQDQGGDDAVDSDADPTNGQAAVTVTTGATIDDVFAGFIPSSSIAGVVFEDLDGNGLQDAGEPGIESVTVTLLDGTGAPFSPAVTTTTAADGTYLFDSLEPGDYIVEFTAPTGTSFTTPNVGPDDTLDSDAIPDDVDPTIGRIGTVDVPLTLAVGDALTDEDAGLFSLATIEAFFFNDTNGNGIQDPTETGGGLAGASVSLFNADTLTQVGTTITLTAGDTASPNVVFSDIEPGNYFLSATLPSGDFAFSPVDATDDATDSDVTPTVGETGTTAPFVVASDATVTTVDIGAFVATDIGGRVFFDNNSNNVFDTGEPGRNGVTVELYRNIGGELTLLQTTTTSTINSVSGSYTFAVVDGDYQIRIIPDAGFTFATPDVGDDDAIDSDVDAGGAVNFSVPSEAIDLVNIDAGLQQPVLPLVVNKYAAPNDGSLPVEPGDTLTWVVCASNDSLRVAPQVFITDTVNAATQTVNVDEVYYGIGSGTECPTSGVPAQSAFRSRFSVPTGNIEALSGTPPQTRITTPNNLSLQPGEYLLLTIEVTVNDPGQAPAQTRSVPATDSGVLAMSTLFLVLGWFGRRLLQSWRVVAAALLVAVIMLGAPTLGNLNAEQGGDSSPAPAQTGAEEDGRWVRYDSNHPALSQVGEWEIVDDHRAVGGSYLRSSDPNAALVLEVSGTQVRVAYPQAWDTAEVAVLANTQQIGLIDGFSVDGVTFATSETYRLPGNGLQTVRLQGGGAAANPGASSAALMVDAIDVWLPADIADEETSNLTGVVWSDTNGNDLLDPADRLIENVLVNLYIDFGTNDTLIDSHTTDAFGRYVFTNLPNDNYWIVIQRDTLPDDLDPTSVDWSPRTIPTPHDGDVIIPPAQRVDTASITGTAWLDVDRSESVTSVDIPLNDVEITLYQDDGQRVFNPGTNGDFPVDTVASADEGAFSFDGLLPGIYWIDIDTSTLPADADQNQLWELMWVTVPDVSAVELLLLPKTDNFGLVGTAYLDNNFNDAVDAEDTPLAEIGLSLYADDGNGVFSEDLDTYIGDVVSNADGTYQFEGLAAGIHWLVPDLDNLPDAALQTQYWPPMWLLLPDIEEANTLFLPAPQTSDFELEGNAVLSGVVFSDDNGNRRFDERNESGIRETIVELYFDGELVATAEVDESGVYRFENLPNGTYTVQLVEGTLPDNFMDTVSYGGHGEQNPQTVDIVGATDRDDFVVTVEGPNFAYALDTDGDGSPDGREGAGDRDNDNIANHLDPFDPTGIVYAADLFGNTKAIEGVEVRLVYREGNEWITADTIQPNPQRTNSLGAYRFDLNVLDGGLPPDGSERVFHLQVEGLNAEELIFPSVMNEPGQLLVINGNNAQVAPSLEPDLNAPFYMAFQANAGDDDLSNNLLGADALGTFEADLINTGCANFSGGIEQCDTAQLSFDVTFGFTVAPLSDAATVLPGDEDVTFEHTLTNDGPLPDRYRIELDSDRAYESQTLTIRTPGGTVLGTIGRGGSFDTDVLDPNDVLELELSIDVPTSGLSNGETNAYEITATSLGAAELDATLSETATDTLTVQAACIVGNVFRDDDEDGFPDSGEGISDVLLNAFRINGGITEIARDVPTADDGRGSYSISVPVDGDSDTVRVEVVEGTLPSGSTFVDPTDNDREVTVSLSDDDCARANFIISVRDVSVTKQVNGPTQVQQGETVFFTIQVANGANSSPVSGLLVDTLSTAAFDVTTITSSVSFTAGGRADLQTSGGSLVAYQIVTLPPGSTMTVSIQATIRSDIATLPLNFQNVASLDFQVQGTTPIQSNIVNMTVAATEVDTDGDGVPDSQDPDPNDPTVTGETGTGGPTEATDPGTFGQDPATGTGDPSDPDALPETGYMPLEYILQQQQGTSAESYETSRLSTAGRIILGIGGLLVIALAVVAFRYYNNSEALYQWLQNRAPWISMALLALIGLLFVGGGAGVLYTANDITGVVDTDNLLGLNDDASDQTAQNEDAGGTVDPSNPSNVPIDGDSDGDGIPDSIDTDDTRNDVNGVSWMGEDGTVQQLPTIGDDTQRFIIPSLNVYTRLVNAPRLGTTWAVDDFFNEVARLEGTAAPGMEGNLVIAGHVTHTRGVGPFRSLDRITLGDTVIVKDFDIEYTYYVTDIMEVAPEDVWVTDDSSDAVLTLITCSGWDATNRTYDRRLVVRARLDKWRIVDAGAEAADLGERTRYEVGQAEEVALEGEWESFNSYNTSEGNYFYSEDKEAGATFSFEGDKFRLTYVMFSNFGEFEVYLDGELLMTIDAYSPYSGFGSTNVIQTTPGRHTLEIRNTDRANDSSKGNVIALDAIDVWR